MFIIGAVSESAVSLGYVSLMGVVFTFVFCTVTFTNYLKDVYSEDTPV